ncbi:AMP-binding protein [uncultured Sphingomonas sp.]|uniref:AMP-binding protein n=1 Tax=uncultured Sphingomonas sp. TaxID=158754 RepID=UPI0025CE6B25|nr:AMP-binding protein [uncultured Sphingomonas sp.]
MTHDSAVASPAIDSSAYPTRPVRMGAKAATIERRPDGSVLVRHDTEPVAVTQTWNQRLEMWGTADPERVFLTEAYGDTRRAWTFGEALADARAIAAALTHLPLSAERPLAILAENSVDCARVTLGAMFAGVPAATISPSYALLASDFAKLSAVIASLNPGAVYVANGDRYAAAVAAAVPNDIPVILGGGAVSGRDTRFLADMLAVEPSPLSRQREAVVAMDDIAKILFTSGSSGTPKPVTISHRMLADNRAQNMLVFAFLQDEPPVMLDWLPWHHTFGGNNNFGFALWAGGTLHIDEGRPTPGGVAATIANLKRYPINLYMSSPSGFEVLIPHLRADPALRRAFFSKLKVMQYGGASLATYLWAEIDDLAVAETGHRILMVSGIGSTECGPTPMQSSWEQHRKPEAGLPVPGVTVKLIPFEDAFELRFAGDCVTRGYWKRPDLTAAAFDDEGFFLTGDLVKAIDPDRLEDGFLFHGRTSDNFKLTSGTWVTVLPLRLRLLSALAPVLQDAVIAGDQRDRVTAIGFPDLVAARRIAGLSEDAEAESVLGHPVLRAWIAERLRTLAAGAGGSSQRIVRVVLEAESPSLANGELTDKAAASARAVLTRRASVVDELYASPPSPRTIGID